MTQIDSTQMTRWDTAAISDALDMLGATDGGPLEDIGHIAGPSPVLGPAFTVRYEPVESGMGPAGDFIDDVPPGAVVVIANAGRTWCTVWGDILTAVAHERGIVATVIDGACRDVEASRVVGYPLWARGVFMRSGKNRVRMVSCQQPVILAGVTVQPGDLVCADLSGVVVVPGTVTERVLTLAQEVKQAEAAILADVARGMTLGQARKRHEYNRFALPRLNSVE